MERNTKPFIIKKTNNLQKVLDIGYIKSSHYIRRLQWFNIPCCKIFLSYWSSKTVHLNELACAARTLSDQEGFMTPPTPAWNRSYCYYNCCLHVIVAKHSFPIDKKIWELIYGDCRGSLSMSHTRNATVSLHMICLRSFGYHHPAQINGWLWRFFSRPRCSLHSQLLNNPDSFISG